MSSPSTDRPLTRSLAALYLRVPLGMRLGLEPMRAACARFGHPERAFEAVHVAGTNGKGSVCAMTDAIARADGRRVGLYTSPHLCRFAERIQIDGAPVPDDMLAAILDKVLADEAQLSFFEAATLAAFLAFREARVDVAVLEVGLGGRLDATNVIPSPRAAAVTRIALDHTETLGPTLEAIAREKAAIAKPGVELLLGPMSEGVRAAIDEVARRSGATTRAIEDDAEATSFAGNARVGLAGAHQRSNAAIAYALGARIGASVRAREEGIANVRWPARLEQIETPGGPVLLDGAHNPDGVAALARHLAATAPGPAKTAVVFGTLQDKAWPEMIDLLAPLASVRVYATPSGRAATDPRTIALRHAGSVAPTVSDAYDTARRAIGKDGLVVVCGSIHLVGETRARLLGLPRDPPVAL